MSALVSRSAPCCLLLVLACTEKPSRAGDVRIASVDATFLTPPLRLSNLDSPAVWFGPSETLFAVTAKQTGELHVHDAITGVLRRKIGQVGQAPGEMRRPNGIAISDDLAFVVERDNRRIQLFALPGFEPVLTFGDQVLRRPYGIAVIRRDSSDFELFVTDDYEGRYGGLPPDRQLNERVKRFRVRRDGTGMSATFLGTFGDTSGPGRLLIVESIAVDPVAGLLLIADEAAKNVKVYRTDGTFTGRVLWGDVIRHEPEGIVLYECGRDGYWILADQDTDDNRFLIFERRSFALAGAFSARGVQNTDGVAIAQRPIGGATTGVLFAVHDDRAVAAISFDAIAHATGLPFGCPTGASPD